jgi:NADPH-dependent 2,4-dienoyl-CoA reductase/sulfur reductase-like enzyme
MTNRHRRSARLGSREAHLKRLATGAEIDVLVVGGGATGAGVALEAALRGYRVALVERADFASGTSRLDEACSRRTPLFAPGRCRLRRRVRSGASVPVGACA